jgi:hypothetical protein
MPSILKSLRLAAVAGVLALGVSAAPSHAATISPETPDCYVSCTKTLKPGQRLVVGNPFAFNSATITGSADGFGTHFVIKNSRDGSTYKAIYDAYGTSLNQVYTKIDNPLLVPGYFRAVAINESTWNNQTVTLSVRVS